MKFSNHLQTIFVNLQFLSISRGSNFTNLDKSSEKFVLANYFPQVDGFKFGKNTKKHRLVSVFPSLKPRFQTWKDKKKTQACFRFSKFETTVSNLERTKKKHRLFFVFPSLKPRFHTCKEQKKKYRLFFRFSKFETTVSHLERTKKNTGLFPFFQV